MIGILSWRHSLHVGILGLLGVALLVVGCSQVHPPTSVGTGIYSYATGTLTWIYPVTLAKLWSATEAEVRDLQLEVLAKHMDGLGAIIKAKRADKTDVDFTLEPVSTQSTRLSVRIGGEEWHRREAEHIHTKIRQRLGIQL
jgi:hypothetical protein